MITEGLNAMLIGGEIASHTRLKASERLILAREIAAVLLEAKASGVAYGLKNADFQISTREWAAELHDEAKSLRTSPPSRH